MARILGIVHGCKACPHRRYYSGGQYECDKVEQVLPPINSTHYLPAWCPLAPHPAAEMEEMRRELNELRAAQTVTGIEK